MRRITCAATMALALLICNLTAHAQDTANTFEQLHARLQPGDMVIVTDTEGRDVRGRITMLSPSSLTIDVDGRPADWSEGRVRLIRHRQRDSVVNGALIGVGVGAGVGFGLGIGVAAAELYGGAASQDSDATVVVILGAALGAATGLAIDAARRDDVVVFRAGGATTASLRLMPLVTPRAQGIRVAVVF